MVPDLNLKIMTTQLQIVEDSKTYQVYENLLNAGFNVSLKSMFSHSYDKDNRYLSIEVKECEDRLTELWDLAKSMEIVLARYAGYNNCHMEVRKDRAFAEFVSEDVWEAYYKEIA